MKILKIKIGRHFQIGREVYQVTRAHGPAITLTTNSGDQTTLRRGSPTTLHATQVTLARLTSSQAKIHIIADESTRVFVLNRDETTERERDLS